ncbi:EthD family reductase [Rhodococcus sp. NPDC057014]|uniref:EthD family reductase n=1 Tax=Rhodococcus sp. NPDC057014 TaxID=3346000 RepID=UPI00362E65F3
MYKLYAFWSAPAESDVASFEEYYAATHVPRASAVPHLESIVTTLTAEGLAGGESAHYRVAEMAFATKAAFDECVKSPEWAEMRACSGDIIEKYGVTLTVAIGEEVIGTPTNS